MMPYGLVTVGELVNLRRSATPLSYLLAVKKVKTGGFASHAFAVVCPFAANKTKNFLNGRNATIPMNKFEVALLLARGPACFAGAF